jgi:bacillithiol biosynthesis deacetylase BshB1
MSSGYIGHRQKEETMKLDVLAIGAHPDDVELTCAGTLINLVRDGRSVGIADLTEGELGTRGTREIRAREAQRAGEIIGVQVRENLRLPDGGISLTRETRSSVITLIRRFRPEILLFPFHDDRHPDHEHAHQLCKEAWFYAGLEKVETVHDGRKQEPHRPKRYYNFMQWNEFQPTFIVDITSTFEKRLEAIRAFRSQFHDPESPERSTVLSDPEFMEMVRVRAEYYGDRIGTRYGEPFFSPHLPGVRDLYAIL